MYRKNFKCRGFEQLEIRALLSADGLAPTPWDFDSITQASKKYVQEEIEVARTTDAEFVSMGAAPDTSASESQTSERLRRLCTDSTSAAERPRINDTDAIVESVKDFPAPQGDALWPRDRTLIAGALIDRHATAAEIDINRLDVFVESVKDFAASEGDAARPRIIINESAPAETW